MKKKKIALIDGDEIAYSVALKYQTKMYTVHRGDHILSHHRYKIDAVEAVENETDLDISTYTVDNLKGLSETSKIVCFNKEIKKKISAICGKLRLFDNKVFLSGPNNFRLEMAKLAPYKGNRDPDDKPIYLSNVKECMRYMGAETVDHLEADDLMSSYSVSLSKAGLLPIICSSDKDLRTVPGHNYNISNRVYSVIAEEDAIYNFYYQLIIGDATDNIPKPYGFGEILAERLLAPLIGSTDEVEYYTIVAEAYTKQLKLKDAKGNYKTKWYKEGMDVNDILFEIGNLLFMRRSLDKNERWSPPILYREIDNINPFSEGGSLEKETA